MARKHTIPQNALNEWPEKQWAPQEWEEFRSKLEKLSLDDLKTLANYVGFHFKGGNDSVKDRDVATAKEQFLLVLDEVDKDILIKEYQKLLKGK